MRWSEVGQMPLRTRFTLLFFLTMLLALAALSCTHKRGVRMPSYWPEAQNQKASQGDKGARSAPGLSIETEPANGQVGGEGTESQGLASWYGEDYHGRKTASGETYNMNALTAAHKTLPFDTRVRVTNVQAKKEVVVRINDRGPFVDGRIIDLSKEAAKR